MLKADLEGGVLPGTSCQIWQDVPPALSAFSLPGLDLEERGVFPYLHRGSLGAMDVEPDNDANWIALIGDRHDVDRDSRHFQLLCSRQPSMSAQKSAVRQDDQGIKDALFFDALDECLVACVTVEGGVDRMGLDAIDWPLFGQVAGQCRG